MVRQLPLRSIASLLMLPAVCLVSSGCRSPENGGGLMGLPSLTDPVPAQWEPPVETLSEPEFQESNPAE